MNQRSRPGGLEYVGWEAGINKGVWWPTSGRLERAGLAKRLAIRLNYLFTLFFSSLQNSLSNYLSESWNGTTWGSMVGKWGSLPDKKVGISLNNNEGHRRDSLCVGSVVASWSSLVWLTSTHHGWSLSAPQITIFLGFKDVAITLAWHLLLSSSVPSLWNLGCSQACLSCHSAV